MTAEGPAAYPLDTSTLPSPVGRVLLSYARPHQALAAIGRAAWDLQTCFCINAAVWYAG